MHLLMFEKSRSDSGGPSFAHDSVIGFANAIELLHDLVDILNGWVFVQR